MSIKTLLVDDESSLLEQAEIFLEREKEIEVETASSAGRALEMMDEEDFDVIVSDYQMPEMDGLEFLEELREDRGNDLPFIMFTGKGREEVAMEALNLGGDRYLQKGGDPSAQYNVLVQAIEQEVEHHRTELDLEMSEERYRKLVESTGEIIIIHDENGEVEFINQAGLDFTGYSEEKVKGKNITDFLPEDEIPELIERKKKRVKEENKDRFNFESAFVNKNGERIVVGVEATPLFEEGEYKGDLVIARDITGRKKSEQKLKESRSRLKRSQKVAKVGSWEIDLETDELTWSDETYSIFEVPKDKSMDYQDFLDRIHPEDRDHVDEKWQEGLENGEYDIQHRIIADGKTKWVREKADIKYDDEGKPVEVIGSVQDITDRKSTEKKLEKSEERYRRLFETAQDGMLIIDAETGVIEDANPFIQDILGYSKEELVGKELWELGTFESVIENKRRFEELVEEGYIRYEDKPLMAKNEEEVPVEFVSNTYEAGGKEVVQCNIRAVSQRKKAEEREEFLHSLLRHDVGSKIQIITGYLDLMREYDLPGKVEDLVEKGEHAAKEGREIIEKVRKLREIGEEDEIGEVDLSSVMDKVLAEHQDQLQERGINTDISECDCRVEGGPLLEELFSNLIENSIQHSECDNIKISSRIKGDEYVVTIEDGGIGIPDEVKDKIFEKGFKRGENAGTGLGLYMVKEIAEIYGGKVEVDDSELGGARFDIHLEKT